MFSCSEMQTVEEETLLADGRQRRVEETPKANAEIWPPRG